MISSVQNVIFAVRIIGTKRHAIPGIARERFDFVQMDTIGYKTPNAETLPIYKAPQKIEKNRKGRT
jgi:hypothetical protein